jgi:catechol 2,3-dioxygenase-like lactoylglutathione lyase family enzyme
MITSINHTGLTVSDLDGALSFYRDALGLEVIMQQEKEGGYLAAITGYPRAHVRMAHLATPDGGRLELFEYVEPQGSGRPLDPSTVGITHVCLVVEDIHEAYRGLLDAGAAPLSEPIEIDTGANAGAYGLYVRDPDGILLELFQPKPS